VLVPRHVSQIFPAGSIVDQVDDECPHDRTPLFDRGSLLPGLYFGATSRASRNGFVSRANGFEAGQAPGRHRGRRRALNARRPRLGGSGAFSKEAAIGGIIGFGNQTRETGKGSNNNAAQAEYDRLAASSSSLKSLKSSSR
jgi:hypothetical protein